MARIFRHEYTKPLPEGAEIIRQRGRRYARWKDKRGRTQRAPLTTDGTRIRVETAVWYVEYNDADGVRRRVPGYADKRATEQLAAELERKTAHQQTGLTDRFAEHRKRPLSEHVDDWHSSQVAKGNTQKHADLLKGRVNKVLEQCGFRYWSDISASVVQGFLGDLRAAGKSLQTCNFYLQAVKQFCRWMVRDRRAVDSPVAHLSGFNIKMDRRHDRRALSPEELQRLLIATYDAPTRFGMPGPERAILYRLVSETGLRASEARTLLPDAFDLQGSQPTVTIRAAYSKRRREDVLPLRPSMAQEMRGHLYQRAADDPVFHMPHKNHVAEMLRADLKTARRAWIDEANTEAERNKRAASGFLAYRDESGRVADFHALRHTFITNLARGGVHPRVAQALARHSTITLTMDRYSHCVVEDQAGALAALPDIAAEAPRQRAKPSGTDG